MLHLCNITAGVWGRYAGEDTRPMYHSLDLGVVANSQRCTENGMYQICNTHVANVQQCMQKKSGGISAPAIFLCLSLLANNKHLFGLYRKWFTLCNCVVGCPNNINTGGDDVVVLQRTNALTNCIVGTIVGCFSTNQVALY